MTGEYAAVADDALDKAEQLRARWSDAGDTEGAALAARLSELLTKERDAARRGELPSRDGGFPLTRFAGEVEWGPEGAAIVDRLYELQRLWERA